MQQYMRSEDQGRMRARSDLADRTGYVGGAASRGDRRYPSDERTVDGYDDMRWDGGGGGAGGYDARGATRGGESWGRGSEDRRLNDDRKFVGESERWEAGNDSNQGYFNKYPTNGSEGRPQSRGKSDYFSYGSGGQSTHGNIYVYMYIYTYVNI
jgi:hypothetical protein